MTCSGMGEKNGSAGQGTDHHLYYSVFFSSFCLLFIDSVAGAGSFVVGMSRCVAAPSLVGFNFQASVVVLCAADVVVQQPRTFRAELLQRSGQSLRLRRTDRFPLYRATDRRKADRRVSVFCCMYWGGQVRKIQRL